MFKIKKNILSTVLTIVMLFGSILPLYAQELSFVEDPIALQDDSGFFAEPEENKVSDTEDLIGFSESGDAPEETLAENTIVLPKEEVVENKKKTEESEIDLVAVDDEMPHVLINETDVGSNLYDGWEKWLSYISGNETRITRTPTIDQIEIDTNMTYKLAHQTGSTARRSCENRI